jgi:hypothetical protein
MEVKMSNILRRTVMASAVAIAAVAFSNVSIAQTKKCIGEACPPTQGQGQEMKNMPENNGETMPTKKLRKNTMQPNSQAQYGEDQGTGQMKKKLRKKGTMSTEQNQNVDVNAQVTTRTTTRTRNQANWTFDSSRHRRHRHRDATFRFYFGGWWYPYPYWQENYYVVGTPGYGISCGQGLRIVAERFNRVRVVECRGRAYTYLGRRHGDDFQILLSSRSGRIIDVNEI